MSGMYERSQPHLEAAIADFLEEAALFNDILVNAVRFTPCTRW
jgi:hypothetical protein